jgi:hypothetical protein
MIVTLAFRTSALQRPRLSISAADRIQNGRSPSDKRPVAMRATQTGKCSQLSKTS